MTRTIFRAVGSKRFSARPRRKKAVMRALGSFDALIARLDAGQARLAGARRKRR